MGLSPHNPPRAEAGRIALDLDWTAIGEEIVAAMKQALAAYTDFAARSEGVGRGAGGDFTLVIDQDAEDAVFGVLERVSRESGAGFTVVSEERGIVDLGGDEVTVVIDPIDGSLNAKRGGLSWSLSLAVASGPTMAEVDYGFVYDFGSDEQWVAARGAGATLDGRLLPRGDMGNELEVVGLESTKPAFMTPELMDALGEGVQRIRSIGSIALTLCQVAAARFDGMRTLRPCRSVDAAAGQLIARETDAAVIFGDGGLDGGGLGSGGDGGRGAGELAMLLDLESRMHVVAARDDARARFLHGTLRA